MDQPTQTRETVSSNNTTSQARTSQAGDRNQRRRPLLRPTLETIHEEADVSHNPSNAGTLAGSSRTRPLRQTQRVEESARKPYHLPLLQNGEWNRVPSEMEPELFSHGWFRDEIVLSTQPKIEVVKSPDYRTINVNGIIGYAKPGYFEIACITEESDYTEPTKSMTLAMERTTLTRTLQCRLVVGSSMMAKVIHGWLENQIRLYEKALGKIPTIENKAPEPSNRLVV